MFSSAISFVGGGCGIKFYLLLITAYCLILQWVKLCDKMKTNVIAKQSSQRYEIPGVNKLTNTIRSSSFMHDSMYGL